MLERALAAALRGDVEAPGAEEVRALDVLLRVRLVPAVVVLGRDGLRALAEDEVEFGAIVCSWSLLRTAAALSPASSIGYLFLDDRQAREAPALKISAASASGVASCGSATPRTCARAPPSSSSSASGRSGSRAASTGPCSRSAPISSPRRGVSCVATGILNVFGHDPADVAREHAHIDERFPGRFLLGIGIGHAKFLAPEAAERSRRPLEVIAEYLDALDRHAPAGTAPRACDGRARVRAWCSLRASARSASTPTWCPSSIRRRCAPRSATGRSSRPS